MRGLYVVVLSLVLGGAAWANEFRWKPVSNSPAALGRPVFGRASAAAAPVTLERPIPLDPPARFAAVSGSALLPAAHQSLSPTFRAQKPDDKGAVRIVTAQAVEEAPLPERLEPVPADGEWDPEVDGWYDYSYGAGTRFYASADYLLWWVKRNGAPALATTGPVASDGILGDGGVILFGNGDISDQLHSGGRFYGGYWLDEGHCWAIEGGYFFLGDSSRVFAADCCDFPVLARPFFNVNPAFGLGGQFSQVICSPGFTEGRLIINSTTRLQGAEANIRRYLCGGDGSRCDLLVGFRYLDLDDNLTISESVRFEDMDVQGRGFDSFSTRNRFYGPQFGAVIETPLGGRWSLECRPKIAFGVSDEDVDINGALRLTTAGVTTVSQGLLLALPTNIGHHHASVFAVVPEVGINLVYQLTNGIRARFGYTFLYWSSVVRSGDQVDPFIDAALIPNFLVPPPPPTGLKAPGVLFKQTDFWAQGLNFGLEFVW